MRTTRNRVYRKLYRGFESPYLRHNKILKNSLYANFFDFIGGDRGMCASGDATQHTIRRYTIRKIIKTEFLSPRVFIDFSYCVSRTGTISARNLPRHGTGKIYGGHRVKEMDAPLFCTTPYFSMIYTLTTCFF